MMYGGGYHPGRGDLNPMDGGGGGMDGRMHGGGGMEGRMRGGMYERGRPEYSSPAPPGGTGHMGPTHPYQGPPGMMMGDGGHPSNMMMPGNSGHAANQMMPGISSHSMPHQAPSSGAMVPGQAPTPHGAPQGVAGSHPPNMMSPNQSPHPQSGMMPLSPHAPGMMSPNPSAHPPLTCRQVQPSHPSTMMSPGHVMGGGGQMGGGVRAPPAA